MIDTVIDSAFGSWGRPAVDFYAANALWINLIVLSYGAALLWLHQRLRPFRRAAVAEATRVLDRTQGRKAGAEHQEKSRAIAALNAGIDWATVAGAGEGTLVAGRWKLWPTRATPQTLPGLLPAEELYRDALAERSA